MDSRPGTSGSSKVRGRSDQLVSVANRLKTAMYVSDRALPPEDMTVASIEAQLRIPSLASGLSEEQLVSQHCGEDGLVTDPDYLPAPQALYPDPNQPPASAVEDITWRRVSGTLYFPRGKTARLLQGAVENGSFLGALGAVAAARGGELLLDLIVSDDAAAAGVYTFQLYKHGCWQQVPVDNYLPCLADQERLAFACSAVVGELWPSLMEKAYAKVHGSYYALAGGAVEEVLVDLTGGVGSKIRLDAAAGKPPPDTASLWQDLQGWLGSGSIIACRSKPKATARRRFMPPSSSSAADSPEGLEGAADAEEAEEQEAEAQPAEAEPCPGGLLRGQVYSILEARSVGSSVQLVRLHCPWPEGIWTGAWATGSPEWSYPVVAPQLDYFRPSWEDEATFWMPFLDFVQHFNRLYISRLFPANWHQLTLHCGWQGPSAGGPYYEPAQGQAVFGGTAPLLEPAAQQQSVQPAAVVARNAAPQQPGDPASIGQAEGGTAADGLDGSAAATTSGWSGGPIASSTWCCNPQFRLTVRKACEVVVCLSQQDPRVAHQGHVPKRHRKRAVGMQVLRVPLDRLGRCWNIRPGEMVATVEPSAAREVSTSFKAQPDSAYVVVPHARRAGEEGAFVLRTFSSQPLELEQLPAPLCLVVGGHWAGFLAGGGRGLATWGSNPQYMISTQQKAQVVASLTRLDLRYSLIKPPYDPTNQLGLALVQPQASADGPGRRAAAHDGSSGGLVAEAGLGGANGNEEVVLQATLEPEMPYLLVPSIDTAGVEAPFELRLMSSAPLELVPLPETQTVQLAGEWGADSSGGCDVHPLWKRNPKYHILMSNFGRVRITLARTGKPRARHPVDDMIGFYILRAANADGDIRGDPRRAVVAESTFVPQPDTSSEYELNGGCHYVIMPCTYSPGRQAKFSLTVASVTGFSFKSLNPPAEVAHAHAHVQPVAAHGHK